MYLHDDQELFQDIIFNTSRALNLPVAVVEKDYYVTLLLKKISERFPDIVFKGGTSLSKCYGLVNRFSEDIDLNISGNMKPSESKRKKLKDSILAITDELHFSLMNPESIRSRMDFNQYIIAYPTQFNMSFLKPHLIIETAIFFRSYPNQTMYASSYIHTYLSENGLREIIANFSLEPFQLNVQTAERTLIDKLFALGDYYLSDAIEGHSRHIYDIYKLLEIVNVDDSLRDLCQLIRMEREPHKTCLSADPNIDMRQLLREIVEKEAYKTDYEIVTSVLLFDPIPYEKAISALTVIIDSNLFSKQ